MKRLLLVGVVLAALLAATASAEVKPLELKRVVATRQSDFLRLRIRLNRQWKSGIFRKGSGSTLTVLYDTNLDGKPDYTGRITFHDGQLYEQITGHGSTYPNVLVQRPTPTDARVKHPSDVLFANPETPGTMQLVVIMTRPGFVPDRLPRKGWWPIPTPR